jgi:hypothetical protein
MSCFCEKDKLAAMEAITILLDHVGKLPEKCDCNTEVLKEDWSHTINIICSDLGLRVLVMKE